MESLDTESKYNPIEAAIHLARYRFAEECGPKGRLLDIACGYGYGTEWLAKVEGVDEAIGVDRDPQALEAARRNSSSGKADFRGIDFSDLKSVKELGRFDTIVCIETIEHAAQPVDLIRALKNQWTGRGPFILSVPNDPFYYGPGRSLNPYHMSSKSWIASRNWLEEELGEAQWYLGTGASGFSVHRLTPAEGANSYVKAFDKWVQPLRGGVLPSGKHRALLPWNSLFYFGVWGSESEVTDTAVLFPTASDYRLPQFFTAPKSVQAGFRPRLLLVADTRDWAYDNIAQQVNMALGDRFVIDIAYQSDFGNDWLNSMHSHLWESKADFVHFFWRETILRFLTNVERMNAFCSRFKIDEQEFAERLANTVITASIYDHLYLDEESIEGRLKAITLLDGLSVSSKRLALEYEPLVPDMEPVVLEDGVDLELFKPDRLERFENFNRELVVGWVGNSTWHSKDGGDPKGFNTILRPALESLIEDGYQINGHFADRNVSWRPREEMVNYYAEIDVLVCSSEIEGTPNPVLEAIACGVPIVSTDVGLVRDVLGDAQKKFILAERSSKALKRRLAYLHDHRDELQILSQENLSRRESIAWSKRMPIWLRFFREAEIRNERFRTTRQLFIETAIKERARAKELNQRLQKRREEQQAANDKIKTLNDRVAKQGKTIKQLKAQIEENKNQKMSFAGVFRKATSRISGNGGSNGSKPKDTGD